uniref:Putative ovule protein n=1 Tax=Solanum chacoense TaxID=4108 RepID=A0A0V0IRY6_SOLCH
MIQCIPRIITKEQNQEMKRVPTKEEVKHVVFELNGDSASGQDGYSGKFFQSCWEIIGESVWNMVRAFFSGYELPRYITHTNLVLIPKKYVVDNFGDLRPISLSTFANKIISHLIHERLSTVLPRIISVNQTGFVKGMSITENVLLA